MLVYEVNITMMLYSNFMTHVILFPNTQERHSQSLCEGLRLTNGVYWSDQSGEGAALYDEKGICEAAGKRGERKAKTDGPRVDSMTLTCSTFNRQFRARIGGLVSHQRTYRHT